MTALLKNFCWFSSLYRYKSEIPQHGTQDSSPFNFILSSQTQLYYTGKSYTATGYSPFPGHSGLFAAASVHTVPSIQVAFLHLHYAKAYYHPRPKQQARMTPIHGAGDMGWGHCWHLVEARGAAKHHIMHGTATTKTYPAQNVNSANDEKPWFRSNDSTVVVCLFSLAVFTDRLSVKLWGAV